MGYYNETSREKFLEAFSKLVNCRMELTAYYYPFEWAEDVDPLNEHLQRCRTIFWEHVFNNPDNDENMTSEEQKEATNVFIASMKKQMLEIEENYAENVQINSIDLDTD